jgi:hypothetical protein
MMIAVNRLVAVVVADQVLAGQEWEVFQEDLVKAELLDVDLVVGFGFY